jgi:3-oxoacyl-[acyl-carrier protein] reductase
VAIHYFKNEAGARETFEQIRAVGGGRARVYAADVSEPDQASHLVGEVLAEFGRLDALVNNAGSLVERKLLAEMDYDLWRRVMALNLDSVFLTTRAVLPRMIQQRSGSIVNVASIAGRNGRGRGPQHTRPPKGRCHAHQRDGQGIDRFRDPRQLHQSWSHHHSIPRALQQQGTVSEVRLEHSSTAAGHE